MRYRSTKCLQVLSAASVHFQLGSSLQAVIVGVLLWFLGAPLAARYSLGPLYVLGAILAVILTNLGTKREGEMSAYSIFNPGARQLPGGLVAMDPARCLSHSPVLLISAIFRQDLVDRFSRLTDVVEEERISLWVSLTIRLGVCAGQLNADAIDQQIRAGNI